MKPSLKSSYSVSKGGDMDPHTHTPVGSPACVGPIGSPRPRPLVPQDSEIVHGSPDSDSDVMNKLNVL